MLALAVGLLCGIAPAAAETVRWSEEVELSQGGALRVERYGEWGSRIIDLPGAGGIIRNEFSFTHAGREVRWTRKDSPTHAEPVLLDFITGVPVVVVPVRGGQDCARTGFPPQGLVAYRWENPAWRRMDASAIPPQWKANLLSAWNVQSRREYHGKLIPAKDKARLESRGAPAVQGKTVTELIHLASAGDEACIRWSPPPDAARDALSRQIREMVEAAPTVDAQLRATDTNPRTITREDYQRIQGKWTGWARLKNCEGMVEHVGPVRRSTATDSSFSSRLVGNYVVLSRTDAPVREFFTPTSTLFAVACDKEAIYLLDRSAATLLTIAVLSATGKPSGAVRVRLPQAETPPGKSWPRIWEARVSGRELLVTLGSYRYERMEFEGGTLLDVQELAAPLPF